jgi:putative pyrroloquinoline-quinone-binding quinoprotein
VEPPVELPPRAASPALRAPRPEPPAAVVEPTPALQLGADPPGQPPSLVAVGALEAEPVTAGVVWRFQSAAPLSGSPAVSPAGLVYIASVEGYVHALGADGAFRWSYGVVGIPIGAPAVDAAGQVYVATTAQRLYALRPDGHLGWMQRSRTRFATPPIWASPGLLYYVGRDRNLYHLATWNSEPTRRFLGQAASVPLASLGEGVVALGTAAPEAQLFRRSSPVVHLGLDGSLVEPLSGGRSHWFAVTRAGLAAFDVATHALAWKAPARRAALSADERFLVVEVERDLVWLAPRTGLELHRAHLPGDASAAPVVTNSGIAVTPLVSGDLLVVEPRSGRSERIGVTPAPLWAPVWSEPSRRVTAAAAGVVVGIDLPVGSGSPGEDDAPDIAPRELERGAVPAGAGPGVEGIGVEGLEPHATPVGGT